MFTIPLRKPAHPRRGLAVLALCLAAPLALPQTPVTDIPVEQLLFDPVPLPADVEALPAPDAGAGATTPGLAPTEEPRPQVDLAAIEEIQAYLASSDESEAEEGPFSNELKENLFSLGRLYQQRGEHRQAVETLLRVQNIIRVNDGLHSMEQIPVIERLVPSYEALEEHKNADEMMDLSLTIYQSHHGENSLEIVPAMAELGEWNVQAFLDRSNMLTNINRVDAQRFLMDPQNYTQAIDDPRNSPLFKLYQAQSNFLNAINLIIQAKAFTHPELLDLERQLVTTYFLRTHRENILYEPDFYLTRKKRKTGSRLNQNAIELMNSEDYEMGQASLKRSIAYLANNPEAPPHALARAMLEDADWDLLYTRKVRAFEKYEEAYGFFHDNPEYEAIIADLIYPDVPRVLPVWLPAPNSREKLGIPADETIDYIGYFDVRMRLDKFGKAKGIKILGSGGQVTRNMEIRLNQYLRNVQFRPRFLNGESETGDIALRYNIGY